MIYLLFAILSSAGVTLVMRLSVNSIKNTITMLAAGYLSCTILSILHTAPVHTNSITKDDLPTMMLGILGGILLLAGFIALQVNTRINGVVLSGVFAKLGVIIPVLISILFFKEQPKLIQILGFILTLIAIILMNSGKSDSKTTSITALFLLLLSNGLADSMAKFFDAFGNHHLEGFYFIFTFTVAFLLSCALAVMKKQHISAPDIYYGLLLGIPNFYSIRFLTKAVMEIPAFIAFPTYSVSTIILISTIGMIFFKEKLTRNQKYGFILILFALILLNI